ncbi:MAG: recombinase family protein [Patescibacteria group bacterium]|mgnify:CR=1 FL=1
MTDPLSQPKIISVYGRVSTSNQENEGTIETQLSAVRDFAHKNSYTIVQEYLDDGWSGDSIVRPALDQLRVDAQKKIWNAVLIYDPDRLARRYSYQELVMDELKEAGIEVIFVTISAPKNPEDKILHGVRGLFAEYERAKISERFRLGKLRKVREGHILTTEAPYGYTYIRNNKETKQHGYYEINPEEARVVKMIFSWITDDCMNIRQVVLELQRLKIPPRKSKRGVWNTSTLIHILHNTTYYGDGRWGTSYAVVPIKPLKIEKYRKTKKTSKRMKPKEEWIAAKIPVTPIIDVDLFNRAQTQLKVNAAINPRNRKYQYLLSTRIYCTCGKTRVGEAAQGGKHLYYRCSDRIYSFPLPHTCLERGINAKIADQLVWGKVAELMSSPKLMLAQTERWMKARREKVKDTVYDLDALQKEKEKLKDQEERYTKAYGAGVFSLDQLKAYTTPLRERIEAIDTQIAQAKSAEQELGISGMPTQDEISHFAKKASATLHALNFETKQAILMNVLDKVIGSQERLEVYGHLPVSSSHVVFSAKYRNRGNA